MNTTEKITWGMELKALREHHNLSIEYVAQLLGLSVATIKRYEGISPKTPKKSYGSGVSPQHIDKFHNMLTSLNLSTSIT